MNVPRLTRHTLAAAAAALCVAPAWALDRSWLGGNADWLVDANWSPLGVPDLSDRALLNSGTATLGSDVTIAGLVLGGGTLAGAGRLTLSGAASVWSAGTVYGVGTVSFGDLAISGPAAKTLMLGRIVELRGSTTWSGNTAANNNTIRYWNGGTLNNLGTFDDANAFDSFVEDFNGGPHAFNNLGSYNKLTATVTTIDSGVTFNNSGTVNLQAGTLRPAGGSSSGVFNIAAGAVLEFRNGNNTLDGATTAGAGLLLISSDSVGADAAVAINGGSHSARLMLSGSTLAGSDHAFQAAASWTGGNIYGAARTSFLNDLTISGASTKTLMLGRIVDLHGSTTWSGNTATNNNVIRFWNGGTLNNLGTFTDANAFDSFVEDFNGGPHAFNNVGSYNKLTATVTTIDSGVAFNNSGSVNLQAGTLRPSGGTSSGVFNIAAGAVLEFRNGNSTLDGATTAGAGLLLISSDNVGADAAVAINGGSHSARLMLSGSTLAGSDHAFQAAASWTGGSIYGAARTSFLNDLTISGASTKTLMLGRIVDLLGSTTWSGNTATNNNVIRFWNGGTLNNLGEFTDANAFDSFVEHFSGGPHAFNNLGSYNKLTDTRTLFDLGVQFANTGLVDVQAGTLQIASALTNEGDVRVAAGATFLGSNAVFVNTGILRGSGTVATHAGGDLFNRGQIQPGDGVGELAIDGDLAQDAAGTVVVELASLASFDRLSVSDDVSLGGTLRVVNAGYAPVRGDSFVVLGFDQRLGDSVFTAVQTQGFGPGLAFEAVYHAHDLTLVVSTVPEPATTLMWLLAGALAALPRLRRVPS